MPCGCETDMGSSSVGVAASLDAPCSVAVFLLIVFGGSYGGWLSLCCSYH